MLGFKSRIFVGVALLVTVSLLILGTLNILSLKDKMVSSLTTMTENKLSFHVKEMEMYVKSRLDAIEQGATHFSVALTRQDNEKLVKMLASSSGLSNVVMAYDDNRRFASLLDHNVDVGNYKQSSWYQLGKNSQSVQLTEMYEDPINGNTIVSAVMQVNEEGQFIGVLHGEILLTDIISKVNEMRFAGGAATLTDRNNVFFASDDPTDIGKTPSQVNTIFSDMERDFELKTSGHLEFPYLGILFDGYFERINLTPDMHWTMMVFVDKATAMAGVREAQVEAIMIGAVLVVMSAICIFIIVHHAYKPLLRLKHAVVDLSQGHGDLTARLEVAGNDDLAQISQAFNQFVENLQHMMLQVSSAGQGIACSIEQLAQTAVDNESVLYSHSIETDQVVTAITEMSASARSVAESVGQSNDITDLARKEASESLSTVNNAIETVSALVGDVESMSERIIKTNADALRINEILTVIGGISDQTNLLALNAAIEAARAGEHGRGFAVVADEVRALAARTQGSTTEISEMLDQLVSGTGSVVSAMDQTKQQCQSTVSKTSDVASSLEIMSRSVTDIDDLSTQIVSAAEQQSTVSSELTKNMLTIKEMVETLVTSGAQTVSATKSLSQSNQELEGLVANFKLQ